MSSTTVRLSSEHARLLKELAQQAGEPMQVVLGKAIEELRRKMLLDATNKAYATLKSHPGRWKEEVAERAEWECTLLDNMEEKK